MTTDRTQNIDFRTVRPDSELARAAVGHYFAELAERFPDGFDPGAGPDADAATLMPPKGIFVVAVIDDTAVACGGLRTIGDGIAEVKRMWVDPTVRGVGLGSRLLRQLESRAVELGHHTIRLDTHDSLTEAIAMYRRFGYREIPAYAENPYARLWFEKQLG